ncbi:MAG: hypothetical protein ACOYD0_09570 [Candidatus Nanopelagicales bacterium]
MDASANRDLRIARELQQINTHLQELRADDTALRRGGQVSADYAADLMETSARKWSLALASDEVAEGIRALVDTPVPSRPQSRRDVAG